MYLHYPEEEGAYQVPHQYLLGPCLLVAPVVHPARDGLDGSAEKEIWFPPGTWIDWSTGRKITGPCKKTLKFPLEHFPLFVRAGSIIPMHPYCDSVGGNDSTIILRLFKSRQYEGEFFLYEDDGESLNYRNECFRVTPLSFRHSRNRMILKLGPGQGEYRGMPDVRRLIVAIPHCAREPRAELKGIAGSALSRSSFDSRSGEARIALDCWSPSQEMEIEFTEFLGRKRRPDKMIKD